MKLLVSSLEPAMGKPGKGFITIEEKDLAEFGLRRFLRITVEDSQQEMPFTKRKGNGEQLGIVPLSAKDRRGRKPAETEPLH